MGKKHNTKAEREELSKKYLSGKQTRKAFCTEHNISTKSLSRWLAKGSEKKATKFVAKLPVTLP